MNSRELLNALSVAERLKDTTRHCYTSKGRHESVAEHSWMMTLMAFFMRDEFPDVDMDKVIRMCIIHDLGECFTGDIPTFDKKQVHEDIEENLLFNWIDTLPSYYAEEMKALYNEMTERKTVEAKIYKAIDSLEALIQHNASDLSTWIPKEYCVLPKAPCRELMISAVCSNHTGEATLPLRWLCQLPLCGLAAGKRLQAIIPRQQVYIPPPDRC